MSEFRPAELLAGLCHTDQQDPLPVWQDGTVSPCFNQLVLGALPHAGMAVFSACYLSVARSDLLQSSPPCGWTLRLGSALLAMLLFAADVVLVGLLQQGDMFMDVLADSCAVLAWLLHLSAILVLQRTAFRRTRGPTLLLLLVLLSVPNLVFTLMISWNHQDYVDFTEPLKFARFVLASVRSLPLLVYLLAFAFPCVGDVGYTLHINEEDGPRIIGGRETPDTGEMVAEDGSGGLSRLFYLWLTPLLRRGQRGELDSPADVYHLPRKLRTSVVCRYFHQCWEACRRGGAVSEGQDPWPRPVSRNLLSGTWSSHYQEEPLELEGDVGLLRVLHKAFGPRFYILGVLKVGVNMLSFAGPLLLSSLVNFMEEEGAPVSRGVWCALGLFASALLTSVLRNIFVFQVSKVALSARAALVSAIYAKALRVSGSSLAGFTLGEVVNLMSTDTDRVMNFFNSFHELWSLPFTFSITLYLLYLQVGVAFLGGLCVALLLVPFNKFLASRILSNNKQMLRHKDRRVKLMTEILFGIRVIKFYAWEPHFAQKVSECRGQELSHLKAIKYLDALCVYTWAALPVVISILTFVTFVLLGHQLTAAKVFTTLALVGMLIVPLNAFPWVLNGILEAKVSLERIQRFFKVTNQDLQAYYALVTPEDAQTSVLLSQGKFSWQGPDSPNQNQNQNHQRESGSGAAKGGLLLHSLDLHITKGSLVVVVGRVGCGKSSLLAALTGELSRLSGVVFVADREAGFGLASQEPWIQHASVRDNILFGKVYDPAFYQAVIEACALSDDLNVLPNGDKTEVGENGVTLSGGQKARLALARAVYMDKDIYLLDDPLAAVDPDVADHLMKKCIMELLRGKTRILCTHRVEFVDKADLVVLMENGTIVKTGTPSEVLPLVEAGPKKQKDDHNRKEKDGVEQDGEDSGPPPDPCSDEDPDLSGAEQKQTGGLAWRVYRTYWAAVGGVLATSILMSLLLMQASKNVSDWWLSHWISALKPENGSSAPPGPGPGPGPGLGFSSAPLLLFSPVGFSSPLLLSVGTSPLTNLSSDVRFYLLVYGSIAAANTVFTALRAFLFAYGAICAAQTIHHRLLDRVLKATVTFFDSTPMGRVLNRFSSDLYSVDDSLPFILNILLANVFGLLGMLVVISAGLPWVLVPLLPLALLYHRTQHFYRHTSRELKRLCSLTLSPVYSHFSETLTGLGTIRASGSSARFEEENARRLEQNQRCLFLSNAAMQWLDIRLQLIGVAVVTGLGVIAVVQHQLKSVDPGLVGLSLSYALSITSLLSGLIFSFTQTEMQLVSVERTEEYSTGLPTEPEQQNTQLTPAWPEQGWLEFRDVVLVYREGLPNALDRVSLVVRPGEKVGIVGRTGSGKSTLFLALFRMVEVNQGQILLDGLDIGSVDLAQLRSRLAIIPQDPFLFSGTIRENLDPCGRHSDLQLLEVLDQCHLSAVVQRTGGLDAEVGERGRTFSVGQRQLLCLARALLTQAKVLCMDEATASVDQKTDQLLQQTIRETFKEKTVLTIAHRIDTIMDCDRVLVMHAGKVVEFDSPTALCQSDRSIFQRLVGQRGESRPAAPPWEQTAWTDTSGIKLWDTEPEPRPDGPPGLTTQDFSMQLLDLKALFVEEYLCVDNSLTRLFLQPRHRRGRSLSGALTLDRADDGGLVVSNIDDGASANRGLREGDELLGATINFDQLSKEEVLEVLKLMEPYDHKLKVLSKNKSRSVGSLFEGVKSPDTMLKDSYNKLYNAKIKKFMKDDFTSSAEGDLNGEVTANQTVQGSSRVDLKHDTTLPRLGVDFGLLKPKTSSTDVDGDSEFEDARDLTDGSNLNLPPMSLGMNGTSRSGAPVPRLRVNAKSQELETPDYHLSGISPQGPNVNTTAGLESRGTFRAPEIGRDLQSSDIGPPGLEIDLTGGNIRGPTFDSEVPKVSIDGTAEEYRMPKFKMPDLGLSEPTLAGPEYKVKTPNEDVALGKLGLKYSKRQKNPDLNVDDPSGYAESPNLRLSGRSPDLDLSMPDADVSQFDLSGPGMPSGEVRVPLKKSKFDLKSPDLDVDATSGNLTLPKFGVSGKGGAGVETHDLSLKTPKIKERIRAPDLPETDFEGPKLVSDAPSVGINSLSGKYKAPKFTMPKFGLPDIPVPDYELQSPDVDLSGRKFKGDLSMPGVDLPNPRLDLNSPDMDFEMPSGKLNTDGPSGKVKMPKFKLFGTLPKNKGVDINAGVKTPELALKSPKIRGIDSPDMKFNAPNLDLGSSGGLDVDFSKPDLDIDSPSLSLKGPRSKLKMPNADIIGPTGKIKMPDFGHSGPKLKGFDGEFKTPDLDLSAPEMKGGIGSPDFNLPEMNLKKPKLDVDLKAPKLDIDTPDANFGTSKLKMPKINLPRMNGPDIDGNLDVNAPELNLKGPKGNLDLPDVDYDGPSGKLKMPSLKMPDFGFSGPKLDGPNLDLKTPNVDLNAPDLNLKGPKGSLDLPDADISGPKFKKPNLKMPDFGFSGPKLDGPNLDLKTPNLGLSGPNLGGGLEAPDINMPKLDLKSPKLDLKTPDLNMDMPSGKLKMPEINTPNWDVKAPSGKLKMPKLDLSGSMPKGPNLDLNAGLKTPDLNLKAPKIKGGFDAPDLSLPNADFKTPNFDMNAPDVNIGSPKSKFKMPKLKMPHFSLPGIGGPDIDGNLDVPNVDLNAPDLNLKGPKGSVDLPDADISGPKFKKPNLKMPDFGFSGPKLDGPNLDLKTPNLGLSGPSLGGGLEAPDINMPKLDLKSPKLDLKTPDLNMDMPSGKLKMPKLDLSGSMPKGPNLDLNAGLKTPDLNLKAPKIKGGFDAPDLSLPNADLKTPNFDMNAPDVNIGSPKSKFKMPKLKMPKFNFPSLKKTDIDGNLDVPNVDLNAPDLNLKGPKGSLDLPDADISGPKFKKPNLKMPDFGFSGPKLDGPNLDLKTPNFDLNAPDLNLKGPKGSLDLPDADISGPKFKKPNLKMPDFGFSGPKLDGPNLDLKTPNFDLNAPDLNLKGPKGSLDLPDADISGPKFKKPNLKMPDFGFSGPKLDGPNLDLKTPNLGLSGPNLGGGLEAPDINMPKLDLKSPRLDLKTPDLNMDMPSGKLKMPEINTPNWDIKAPSGKLKMPKLDLSGSMPKGPNLDLNAGLKTPDLNLKAPKIKGGFDAPDLSLPNADLKTPNFDMNAPDVNIGSPKSKFKMPKLKMPKFNFPSLKKPDIDGNLDVPNVDLNAPDLNLKGPKGSLDLPDADISGPKFKKPNLKMPDFGFSGPKLDGPNLDLKTPNLGLSGPSLGGGLEVPDINMPKVDLKSPKLDLNTPKLNMDMPSGKLKMPKLKSPNLNLKAPKIKGGLDAPDLDLPNLDLKAPSLDLDKPDLNIGSPNAKLKMPKLKMPSVNMPNLKGPEIDGNFDGPGMDINAPNINLKGSKPGFEMPDVGFGSPSANLKKPHLKMPDVGFSGPRFDGPDLDFNTPDLNAKLPKGPNLNINSDLKTPDLNLKTPKIKGGIDAPKLDLPNMGLKAPKLDVNTPDVDFGLPDAKFKKPQIKMPKGPDVDFNGGLKGPDLHMPNVNLNGPRGNLKMPRMNTPDFHLSGPEARLPDMNISGPRLRGPGINMPDFDVPDARLKGPTNLAFSPQNAKVNMKPRQIQGPKFSSPNMGLNMPHVAMRSPQMHPRSPVLNIDDPSVHIRGSSFKNRRSDFPGNMRMPDLDIDQDIRFSYGDARSPRSRARSSYPAGDPRLGPYVDFNRSDLNIDDFTGRDHVLRARGTKLNLQGSHSYGQVSPPGVNVNMRDPRFVRRIPSGDFDMYAKHHKAMQPMPRQRMPQLSPDSRIRVPDGSDGYYVTVFPNQSQNPRMQNRHTLGGPGFHPRNFDLEVPGTNDLKGNTFFFSNLI
ncbi:hypothetical protein L3Q82_020045%2C partial [Xyrichtys novacula]|uniref:ATP-binding cassette sub-family C member 10 n=1 Tax=Xyrichtys novacula TaxID=13765 RepID=A0AAV1EZZ7_XYRNO|nr:hypothetical protein L3Q82_020045%2C partial [Xyrichtys novacula]